MILVFLAAAAAAQSTPPVRPNVPPVVVMKDGAAPERRPRSIVELSNSAREKVQAMSERADRLGDAAWEAKVKALEVWKREFAGPRFDMKAIAAAAAAMDRTRERDGVFAKWAVLFGSLGAEDQEILSQWLRRGNPRLMELDVPTAPSAPAPAYPPPSLSQSEQASRRAFDRFVSNMFNAPPDPAHRRTQEDFVRIRGSLSAIAHRRPFDANALARAYRALGEAKGRLEARRNEMVAQRLGELPEQERLLVIERIPELATVLTPMPPPQPSR